MTTVKKEGFHIPGSFAAPARPSYHRQPFSDGSMAVETDMLASLMSPHRQTQPIASPFTLAQSLPTHAFDYPMTSPAQSGLYMNSPPTNSFQPSSLFNNFKFGNEHPEPPITIPASVPNNSSQRSRSHSSSRSSHIGKAPSSKSRPARKLSMTDARPPIASSQQRGRSMHSTVPLSHGLGLDTHKEGERTDSVSPPEFGYSPYGMAMPLHIQQGGGWNGTGSMPGALAASFGTTADEGIDSPITPAQHLPVLPADEISKKQRRRECHNQVEKRRREHINAKIEELSQLVPLSYENDEDQEDDEEDEVDGANRKKKTKRANSTSKHSKDSAHCKGRILSKSVQYIRDLKRLSDFQANRIAHLEAMLSASNPNFQPSAIPVQAAPAFWDSESHQQNGFTFTNHVDNQLGLNHSTADSDRLVSLEQLGQHAWAAPFQPQTQIMPSNLISFDHSPTEGSSGSVENHRRSSSMSSSTGSQEEDTKEGLMGMMEFVSNEASRNRQSVGSFLESDDRGRQRERSFRKESQPELQQGMSGMDLDSMYSEVRGEGDHGGMRW